MSAPINRLEQAIAQLGAELEPPDGWEARVLEAIHKPKKRRWWWWAAPMLALAVLVVVIRLWGPTEHVGSGALALDITYDKTGPVVRSVLSAHPGDLAHAKLSGARGLYRGIWIYRDGTLVVVCPGPHGCSQEAGGLVADVLLEPALYHLVAWSSAIPLLPSSGNYDTDVARGRDVWSRSQDKRLPVRH